MPEVIAIHLATDAGHGMGANWNGRQTPEFGPQDQSFREGNYE